MMRPGIKVYAMTKDITDTVIYDEQAVKERYGFGPKLLIDFKGLKGDVSDNIPGVKGIGEKTASELIKNFGSIEKIYKKLHPVRSQSRRRIGIADATRSHRTSNGVKRGAVKISPTLISKLKEGEQDAYFSKELARIKVDVPLEFSLAETEFSKNIKQDMVHQTFLKFGFSSLLKRFNQESLKTGASKEQAVFLTERIFGEKKLPKLPPQKKFY